MKPSVSMFILHISFSCLKFTEPGTDAVSKSNQLSLCPRIWKSDHETVSQCNMKREREKEREINCRAAILYCVTRKAKNASLLREKNEKDAETADEKEAVLYFPHPMPVSFYRLPNFFQWDPYKIQYLLKLL